MTIEAADSAWVFADSHPTCNYEIPSQWICNRCTTANWEAKTYCRKCWRQRTPTAWAYPARSTPQTAQARGEQGGPCIDCGLHTDSQCIDCRTPEHAQGSRWKKSYSVRLCERCNNKWTCCHHCRGVAACTPMPHGHEKYEIRPDGMPSEIYPAAGPMNR